MISKIPTGALILGLSGVIPFGWGAVTLVSEEAFNFGIKYFGARFVGPLIQLSYGIIILCFMSGVLWGFATKMDKKNASMGCIRDRLYTICHSSLMGILRNGQRAN